MGKNDHFGFLKNSNIMLKNELNVLSVRTGSPLLPRTCLY